MSNIQSRILELATIKKQRIGIGIKKATPEIINSLVKASEFADIFVVGEEVANFESRKVEEEKIEQTLVDLLGDGSIAGIIRGQGDAYRLRDHVCQQFNYNISNMFDVPIIEHPEHEFIFVPCTNAQGWTKEQKIQLVNLSIELLKKFKIRPKIGFLTAVRPGSRGRNEVFDETYRDADYLVDYYVQKKLIAKNYNIELETAFNDRANIIVTVNGIAGNQTSRALVTLGGLKWVLPVLGIKENLNENFRNETDFSHHIIWAVARANS